jgi:hypothetical protein
VFGEPSNELADGRQVDPDRLDRLRFGAQMQLEGGHQELKCRHLHGNQFPCQIRQNAG